MKTNLISGLRTAFGYAVMIAVLVAFEVVINVVAGRSAGAYIGMPFCVAAAVGFVVAFICGYSYPSVLARAVRSYSGRYPDVAQEHAGEKCQAKVKGRYSVILGCLCIICSFFFDMDEHRLIVYAFMCGGLVLLFQYLKYRQIYKDR